MTSPLATSPRTSPTSPWSITQPSVPSWSPVRALCLTTRWSSTRLSSPPQPHQHTSVSALSSTSLGLDGHLRTMRTSPLSMKAVLCSAGSPPTRPSQAQALSGNVPTNCASHKARTGSVPPSAPRGRRNLLPACPKPATSVSSASAATALAPSAGELSKK